MIDKDKQIIIHIIDTRGHLSFENALARYERESSGDDIKCTVKKEDKNQNRYFQAFFGLSNLPDSIGGLYVNYKQDAFVGKTKGFKARETINNGIFLISIIGNALRASYDQFSAALENSKYYIGSLVEQLGNWKRWLNSLLIGVLSYLQKNFSIRTFREKSEGFIRYSTWPRPPTITQHAKFRDFIDMLSQNKTHISEIPNVC